MVLKVQRKERCKSPEKLCLQCNAEAHTGANGLTSTELILDKYPPNKKYSFHAYYALCVTHDDFTHFEYSRAPRPRRHNAITHYRIAALR